MNTARNSFSAATGFGRVEASIFGESALIDRETGRVYWECGDSNTLYESITPKLDQYGVEHAQATFLTIVITLAFLSVLSGWLQRVIAYYNSSVSTRSLSLLILLAEWTILKLPKIENKWLVLASLIFYFYESYNCSTRHFLANAMSSSSELDTYIDSLRNEQPIVTWKVKTFHYELRRIFAITTIIRSLFRSVKKTGAVQELSTSTSALPSSRPLDMGLPIKSARNTPPMFLITRKVVTNEASANYMYTSCNDNTIAGVWTRAQTDSDDGSIVPFTKISLSKVLVLADKRSREHYFQQQSDFVTKYGREDEFAEFSTHIDVTGYRPRLLAHNDCTQWKTRMFRTSIFWMFTCLGLTVPYRVWFKRHCDFIRVTIVKETKAMGATDSYLRSWFPSQGSLRFSKKKRD
ncbi:unnamed protein product [Pseudo-nitzschia multistriata]|uniref:Uncharacterized protein n=1 Tax=Pseudo-nitzschia multistriata TaxID=183589 RepID=A0A448ZNG8_9STRA|nr:unnamed protein product [Pseudo-nitzschia multistriata]